MLVNKLNILVVDDVSFYKSLIQSHLDFMKISYSIFYESNIKDAQKKIEELRGSDDEVNMILSDLMMPDGSGKDLAEIIRGSEINKNLPFIIVTSETDKMKLLDCLTAGADGYLTKPWTIEDFKNALDTSLKKHNISYIPS